ncbi:MAG: CDP-alcohol phosphatidyltransferase family protein [Elusimicrobia bacterium]|nr:CDP-alcohol phosphatidyltransferase family protein [Elusimicrobiota bacterium]
MARPEPFFTAPNLLTLSRVPLAALVWLRPANAVYIISLMVAAGATDVLDGWLERRALRREGLGEESPPAAGMWLDPVCDKLFAFSVIAAVIVTRRPPVYLILLLVAREIVQTLITLTWKLAPAVRARLRPEFQASLTGKAATVFQFLTIAAILTAHPWQLPLAAATGALGLTAIAFYILRSWKAADRRP